MNLIELLQRQTYLYCRICKKEQPFEFLGEQPYPHKDSDWLWDCSICGGTHCGPRPEGVKGK